jgi:DNA mismatch endonuclease (patch repair protein)
MPKKSAITAPAAETTRRMRAVRQRDTAPELEVRRRLHALGVRYRVCPRDLPGRPDLANRAKGWALFVHGCFWHGHDCRLGTKPKANAEWWRAKIAANRERDERKKAALEALGLRVFVVWQCELDRLTDEALLSRLRRATSKTEAEPASSKR